MSEEMSKALGSGTSRQAPRRQEISNYQIGQIECRTPDQSGHRRTPTRRSDEEERITLMKSSGIFSGEGLQISSEFSSPPRPRQILAQRMSEFGTNI